MQDIRLALMCGIDIPIPEIQATIHQPKIKEIAFLGEKDFFTGVQCLSIDKNILKQDRTLLQSTNNFQIFMTIMSEAEPFISATLCLPLIILSAISLAFAFAGLNPCY